VLDKQEVLAVLIRSLDEEVAVLLAAADATYRGATHAEAKPEHAKDTRALEASYLARGQAMRVEETREAATRLRFLELRRFGEEDAVGPTALVHVTIDGEREEDFFLVPFGGGRTLDVDGTSVRVVTTASPVGRAMLGKRIGDDFTLSAAHRSREYVIETIA
jgi:transcription elongation GreA/GreB family factor